MHLPLVIHNAEAAKLVFKPGMMNAPSLTTVKNTLAKHVRTPALIASSSSLLNSNVHVSDARPAVNNAHTAATRAKARLRVQHVTKKASIASQDHC